MSELWDRLRRSPRSQAAIVVTLVVGGLAVGTAIQNLPSESIQSELSWFRPKHGPTDSSCPGPRKSAAHRICEATLGLSRAYDNETKRSAYELRAAEYYHQGRNDLALRDADAALSLGGATRESQLTGLFMRGHIHLANRDAAEAESDFSQALSLNEEDARLALEYDRGLARIELGKPHEALSDFNDAFTSLRKDEDRIRAIQRQFERGLPIVDLPKAEALYAASIARTKSHLFASRAVAYRALGQYDESLADYDAAIRLTPVNASLYSGRARTEFAMGNWRAGFGDFWIRTKLVWGGK